MSRAASIPRFFFTRATVVVVVAVKNLLNAKSESVKIVTLPRPFLANSADTHTQAGGKPSRPAGTGAPHTRNPQKSKNHWRHERTTVVLQQHAQAAKQRT